MNLPQLFKAELRLQWDWFGLVLMAFSAPWISALVHSAWVFHRGTRLYNAEVGGVFFDPSQPPYPQPTLGTAFLWISRCAAPAGLTLVVLLFFRKRTAYRWLAWGCLVALWTWACFKTETAYR